LHTGKKTRFLKSAILAEIITKVGIPTKPELKNDKTNTILESLRFVGVFLLVTN